MSRRGALRSRKLWIAATVAVAVIGVAGVALGLPGSGVTSTTLVTANFDNTLHMNSDGVKLQTKDATDVRVQKLEFAAGSYSGWHHHPGIILVAVASGAVTLWDPDCNSVTYGPDSPNGAVFAEGGDDPVQATSTNGATAYVTYVAPNANPPVFRIEDDLPPDFCA
jgi:hypothetical protein